MLGLTIAVGAAAPALAGTTERVSVGPNGAQAQANGDSVLPSISANGRFIAFASDAGNLVPDDSGGLPDVFVHDRQRGRTERVSIGPNGTEADAYSWEPSISADGRFVAFESGAGNLVPDGCSEVRAVFVYDRRKNRTEKVSVGLNGAQANSGSYNSQTSISADGQFIAFVSYASNLVPDDTNEVSDVFVRDRKSNQTERVSVGLNGTQANGYSEESEVSISADGRFVAFVSEASNLVPDDTNEVEDVFVHDRQRNQTERVSVGPNGTQVNEGSWDPSISADGRFVTFVSEASDLVPGDTNQTADVFVHDRQRNRTERVSVGQNGNQANEFSGEPSISADGRFVAFVSEASNLVPGSITKELDVFIHDRQRDKTQRVSLGRNGARANESSSSPSISADGRLIAFDSFATNLVRGDTNKAVDVFVHRR